MAVLTALGPSLVAGSHAAGASSISSLRNQVASLASQIANERAEIDLLSQQYDQAQARVAQLHARIVVEDAAIAKASHAVSGDRADVRHQAIVAYVEAGSATGPGAELSGTQQNLPLQQTYISAATSTLADAVDALRVAERALTWHRNALRMDETAAQATEASIGADRSKAVSWEGQLEHTLSNVQASLAAAVAAQARAEQAAAEARLAAQQQAQLAAQRQAAAQQAQQQQVQQQQVQQQQAEQQQVQEQSATTSASPPAATESPVVVPTTSPAPAPAPQPVEQPISSPPPSTGGGGAGSVALQAAESQLGVPYVWGGATPGVGFDCSGLTMWAWGQAGVSLAHGATDQYYEIAHIQMPPSDPTEYLEPGDLIFYGDASYLYHVVMYVGGGTVIQAPQTGETVSYAQLWPGWYGAGRP